MIYLLTGPVNCGKTSWILDDYQKYPEADGFACKKVSAGSELAGYDLLHLKTGLTCPLIRTLNHLPPGWDETARLNDRFSFSSSGFLFARHVTQNAILNNVGRFYLDEAGHLELQGNGFHHLLEALLGADIDLVVVVRDTLLERFVAAYKISDYELIRPF